jgi:DNA-binding HxlR family transcriptional regulator
VQTRRRSYTQHCGLARSLDVVGERWTLLIVRELLLGPRRYGDLVETLEGLTTNLLAKRLREMTAAGLVEKRAATAPATGDVYALTARGRALEPVLMELGRWGGPLLEHPRRGDTRNIGWALLSLKRRYRNGKSSGAVEVTAGARRFELAFGAGRLDVEERPSPRADVKIYAEDPETLFELFMKGVSPKVLQRRGVLAVSGDARLFEMLLASLT